MESTLNTHFDDQRARLIAIAADNSQLDTQISMTDNQWAGYDFALDRIGNELKTGVRMVNVDGAIVIHTFTDYLLAGTYTINGQTTGSLIRTIIKTQLEYLMAVAA
jgi:hypothetical protein